LSATYAAVTVSVPTSSARGIVRRGSRVSSAVYVTMCHPPKANRPAATAAATALHPGPAPVTLAPTKCCGSRPPSQNPATTIAATARTLPMVNPACTALPNATPR